MYEYLYNTLFSLVGTSLSSVYSIYPVNFKAVIPSSTFIKVELLLMSDERRPEYSSTKKINGQLIFQIYTKDNTDDLVTAAIADRISNEFQDKLVGNYIVFGQSKLDSGYVDREDRTLIRTDLVLNFTYYGE